MNILLIIRDFLQYYNEVIFLKKKTNGLKFINIYQLIKSLISYIFKLKWYIPFSFIQNELNGFFSFQNSTTNIPFFYLYHRFYTINKNTILNSLRVEYKFRFNSNLVKILSLSHIYTISFLKKKMNPLIQSIIYEYKSHHSMKIAIQDIRNYVWISKEKFTLSVKAKIFAFFYGNLAGIFTFFTITPFFFFVLKELYYNGFFNIGPSFIGFFIGNIIHTIFFHFIQSNYLYFSSWERLNICVIPLLCIYLGYRVYHDDFIVETLYNRSPHHKNYNPGEKFQNKIVLTLSMPDNVHVTQFFSFKGFLSPLKRQFFSKQTYLNSYFFIGLIFAIFDQPKFFPILTNNVPSLSPTILEFFVENQFFSILGYYFGVYGFMLFGLWCLYLIRQYYTKTNKNVGYYIRVISYTGIISLVFSTLPFYAYEFLFLGPLGFVSRDNLFNGTIFDPYNFQEIGPGAFRRNMFHNEITPLRTSAFGRGRYFHSPVKAKVGRFALETFKYRPVVARWRRLHFKTFIGKFSSYLPKRKKLAIYLNLPLSDSAAEKYNRVIRSIKHIRKSYNIEKMIKIQSLPYQVKILYHFLPSDMVLKGAQRFRRYANRFRNFYYNRKTRFSESILKADILKIPNLYNLLKAYRYQNIQNLLNIYQDKLSMGHILTSYTTFTGRNISRFFNWYIKPFYKTYVSYLIDITAEQETEEEKLEVDIASELDDISLINLEEEEQDDYEKEFQNIEDTRILDFYKNYNQIGILNYKNITIPEKRKKKSDFHTYSTRGVIQFKKKYYQDINTNIDINHIHKNTQFDKKRFKEFIITNKKNNYLDQGKISDKYVKYSQILTYKQYFKKHENKKGIYEGLQNEKKKLQQITASLNKITAEHSPVYVPEPTVQAPRLIRKDIRNISPQNRKTRDTTLTNSNFLKKTTSKPLIDMQKKRLEAERLQDEIEMLNSQIFPGLPNQKLYDKQRFDKIYRQFHLIEKSISDRDPMVDELRHLTVKEPHYQYKELLVQTSPIQRYLRLGIHKLRRFALKDFFDPKIYGKSKLVLFIRNYKRAFRLIYKITFRFFYRKSFMNKISPNQDTDLHYKKLYYRQFLNSLRNYKFNILDEENENLAFKRVFFRNNSKSISNKMYNHQFKGTLGRVRRYHPCSQNKKYRVKSLKSKKLKGLFFYTLKYDQNFYNDNKKVKYHSELDSTLEDDKNILLKDYKTLSVLKDSTLFSEGVNILKKEDSFNPFSFFSSFFFKKKEKKNKEENSPITINWKNLKTGEFKISPFYEKVNSHPFAFLSNPKSKRSYLAQENLSDYTLHRKNTTTNLIKRKSEIKRKNENKKKFFKFQNKKVEHLENKYQLFLKLNKTLVEKEIDLLEKGTDFQKRNIFKKPSIILNDLKKRNILLKNKIEKTIQKELKRKFQLKIGNVKETEENLDKNRSFTNINVFQKFQKLYRLWPLTSDKIVQYYKCYGHDLVKFKEYSPFDYYQKNTLWEPSILQLQSNVFPNEQYTKVVSCFDSKNKSFLDKKHEDDGANPNLRGRGAKNTLINPIDILNLYALRFRRKYSRIVSWLSQQHPMHDVDDKNNDQAHFIVLKDQLRRFIPFYIRMLSSLRIYTENNLDKKDFEMYPTYYYIFNRPTIGGIYWKNMNLKFGFNVVFRNLLLYLVYIYKFFNQFKVFNLHKLIKEKKFYYKNHTYPYSRIIKKAEDMENQEKKQNKKIDLFKELLKEDRFEKKQKEFEKSKKLHKKKMEMVQKTNQSKEEPKEEKEEKKPEYKIIRTKDGFSVQLVKNTDKTDTKTQKIISKSSKKKLKIKKEKKETILHTESKKKK
uniref:conserved chloroplast protein Ycf1/TIC214 n=1 Tax=Prototheca tumulicola TaxID=1737639 RepID=UPI00300239E2